MTEFKCSDCKEEFDHEINCRIHHLHTKHQSYEVLETGHKMIIKTA